MICSIYKSQRVTSTKATEQPPLQLGPKAWKNQGTGAEDHTTAGSLKIRKKWMTVSTFYTRYSCK